MPNVSPVNAIPARLDAPCLADNPETHRLVIDELESIRPTPTSLPSQLWTPQQVWQWLAQLLRLRRESLTEDEAELAKILESGRMTRMKAEAAEQALRNAQQKSSQPGGCSLLGLMMLASATAATAGAAVYLSRHWGAWNADNTPPGNGTDMALPPDNEPALPLPAQALALQQPLPSETPPAWLASLVTRAREDLVARFPGIQPDAVEQLIFAPLIKRMFSHGSFGISQAMVQQQLALLGNVLIPTLTAHEMIRLCSPASCTTDCAEIADRFALISENTWIDIERLALRLRVTPEGTPFILDNDGRCRFIRFNQLKMRWEFVHEIDNVGYSAEGRELIANRLVTVDNVPAQARLKYNPRLRTVIMIVPGAKNVEGAFVRGRFIPVNVAEIAQKNSTTSATQANKPSSTAPTRRTCSAVTRNSVVHWSEFGWVFEPASNKMDDELKVLLSKPDKCIQTIPGLINSGPNKSDGLYHDNRGLTFLKKDEQYFNVAPRYNAATGQSEPALTDFPGAFIAQRDGVMVLKQAEEIIPALANTWVDSFSIEPRLIKELAENGAKNPAKPAGALAFPGLYRGEDDTLIFAIKDQRYAVREYSPATKTIRVKYADAPGDKKKDIALWSTGNTVLRVRESLPGTSYLPLPFSYNTGKESLSVKVENDLHRQLQNSGPVTLNTKNLIDTKDFNLPLYWSDTQSQQHYFFYNGKYHPATLTHAADVMNPLGINYLTILDNKHPDSKKQLTTLVERRTYNQIELKTLPDVLSEGVKISKPAAELYLKNAPWHHVAGAQMAQEAVSVVKAKGKFYVAPPPKDIRERTHTRTDDDRRQTAAAELYPAGVDAAKLTLSRLNDKTLAGAEKGLQQKIANAVGIVKYEMLPLLDKSLQYDTPNWPQIKAYLGDTLQITSDEFHSAIAASWRKKLEIIKVHLQEEKSYFLSGNDIHLTPYEQAQGKIVFRSPADGEIYINSHKMPANDPGQLRLIAGLIQAMAQGTGLAREVMDSQKIYGPYSPLKNTQAALTGALMQDKLPAQQLKNIQQLSRQWLENVPAYSGNIDTLLKPQLLAYLAESDPSFQAHLLVGTDPLLTQLSLGAYYRLAQARNTSSGADGWRKAYGALLASGTAQPTVEAKPTTTPAPHHHVHLPEPPHMMKKQRRIADGDVVEQSEDDVRQSDETSGADRRSNTGSSQSRESSRETEREEGSDTDLDSSREAGSEEGYDADVESNRDTASEEGSDKRAESSREEGSEEGYDADVESGQNTGSDETSETDTKNSEKSQSAERTDSETSQETEPKSSRESDTLSSRETESEELTDSDTDYGRRADTPSSRRLPSVDFNPLHPVGPPPIPPGAGAGAAAASAVAWGGMAAVAAAPRIPLIDPRSSTTTEKSTSKNVSTIVTKGHQRPGNEFLIHPQSRVKNTRKLPPHDSHDDVFLPGLDSDRMGTGIGIEQKEIVAGYGNITVRTIPGLECLGEKDVTVPQIIRWIGETLTNTITTNMAVHQEIYHIETKGGDCPNPEASEWLTQRTMLVDATINTIISFIPKLAVVAILKNFVGPAMMSMADSLEGKEMTQEQRMNLLQNSLWMADSMVRSSRQTFIGTELVPGKSGTAPTANAFSKRFKFEKGENP